MLNNYDKNDDDDDDDNGKSKVSAVSYYCHVDFITNLGNPPRSHSAQM